MNAFQSDNSNVEEPDFNSSHRSLQDDGLPSLKPPSRPSSKKQGSQRRNGSSESLVPPRSEFNKAPRNVEGVQHGSESNPKPTRRVVKRTVCTIPAPTATSHGQSAEKRMITKTTTTTHIIPASNGPSTNNTSFTSLSGSDRSLQMDAVGTEFNETSPSRKPKKSFFAIQRLRGKRSKAGTRK